MRAAGEWVTQEAMSRSSVLLSVLTREPASTSELYDRVGYAELARIGLIPYPAFRAELAKLAAAGLAEGETGADGATRWKLAAVAGGEGASGD